MENTETFRSKVDGWFIAVAAVITGVGIISGFSAASLGTVLPVVVALPIVGSVLWIWRSTRYVVTDTSLRVRCGFMETAVPLADITGLRRTSTVLAAPALSLDRLEVRHAGGAVVISPVRREQFVAAITSRNPLVDVAGVAVLTPEGEAQARRHARTLGLALTGVLLAVVGLVAALNFYQLPPARVTVTDTSLTVVSGPARMVVVPSQVTSLSLEDALPPLRKRVGWGTYTSLRGRFSTDEAAGWVHVARRRPPFIVLRTADSFLILNDSDPAKTKATFDSMLERWHAARR
jgi:hypothetical protein